jgi:predicted ATPase
MKPRHVVHELVRRKVFRTAVIYAAAAWLLIEVSATVLPALGASDTMVRVVVIGLIAGLPAAIVLSWIFDISPEGLKLEALAAEPAPAAEPRRSPAGDVAAARRVWSAPPAPPGSLIGRSAALAELQGLLGGTARLVTVTGPGGMGKTRIGVEMARRAGPSFEGGLAYVPLAPVGRAVDVPDAIAQAVGATEAEGRSSVEGVAAVIGEAPVLLVLDNLEHVLDAAEDVARLLALCPRLKVLATSRAPLKIAGEHEYALPPLELPPEGLMPPLEELAGFPAVRLFLERAAAAGSAVRLTSGNAGAIVGICRRLDGLPLALELAAARTRVLQPDLLLQRLERSLDVLTTGTRDLPVRQRTLRATIDWSHSLLPEHERVVFRRLAVFAGGWTGEAAAAVCGAGAASLDVLQSLVEHTLVQPPGADGRFSMLHVIREFALEQLEASGETDEIRERHAAWYHRVALEIDDALRGPRQVAMMIEGAADDANIQDALAYGLARGRSGDEAATERALMMTGALFLYWHIRGYHLSARQWSADLLAASGGSRPTLGRARALHTAGLASWTLGQYERARDELRESYEIARGAGVPLLHATTAVFYGVTEMTLGHVELARELLAEAERIARELGDDFCRSWALTFLGMLDAMGGDADAALRQYEHAAALQRKQGDREGEGISVSAIAQLRQAAGDIDGALALYATALAAFEDVGDRPEEARVLDALAWCALAGERIDEARRRFLQSLQAYDEVGSVRGVGVALFGLAACAAVEDDAETSVRIAAAADVHSSAIGIVNVYPADSPARSYIERARSALPESVVERLTAEGRALTVREAVRYAVESGRTDGAAEPDGPATHAAADPVTLGAPSDLS